MSTTNGFANGGFTIHLTGEPESAGVLSRGIISNADGTYSKSLGDQTRRSLAIIRAALEALGGRIEHVMRTRMYVTDVSKWEEVARVHGEVFAEIRPATTIVEVARLIDGDAQIEIEADAVVA